MDRKNLPSYYTQEDLRVIKLFKEEMDRINLLYLKAIHSDDITKANQLLKKLQSIANTLYKEYGERADIKIPTEYLKGVGYIDNQDGIDDNFSTSLTKGEIKAMLGELGPIHTEAVNALLNNSKNYVKASLDGMERQALTMLNELQQEKVREQLAKGMISGDGVFNMNKRVEQYFRENNITSFKDKGGKTWSMERYIDLLTRTETSIANVQGTINRALESGITKFRIIERPDCCEECNQHHGKVVDIRDGAVDLPPFHPNCRGFIIMYDDLWEEISPRKDEPWEALNIPKDVYDYLKDDIDKVREKRNGNSSIGLVDEAILRNYTGSSYKNINKGVPEWVANRMDRIIQYHPGKSQTVYRGMTFTEAEWNKYLQNGEIQHKGFMSTSTDKDRAKLFSKKNVEGDRNIKVIIEIKARGGMDIHNYSISPKQKEVLFQSGKTLKIDSSSLKSQGQYLFIKGKING